MPIDDEEMLENLDEGCLFYHTLKQRIRLKEDTLYCVRMWFGSGLDFFQWKILREDVMIHNSNKCSASLPFTRYQHILVFDPSIIKKKYELEEIHRICGQWNISLLPLNLYMVFPNLWSKSSSCFRIIKERLKCLFAYYLKHVALFDFNVRLKKPIHSMMLMEESQSFSPRRGYCLMSASNGDYYYYARTDAFLHINFSDVRPKDVNLKYHLRDCYSSLVSLNILIKPIDKYVTRCRLGHSKRGEVGHSLFFANPQRTVLLREMLQKRFPGKEYTDLTLLEKKKLEKLIDASLFHQQVINNVPSRFSFRETDTLYFIRMWFGSDLTKFQWKILQQDVSINSSSSLIPSRLPFFNRYRHVLVFDSTLVTEEIAAKINFKCKELDIHPLDIDLSRVIPFLLEENWYATSMYRMLLYAKDRLQCLFTFYVNNVAFFDFDVTLKMSIHQMLKFSHILFEKMQGADTINNNYYCLVSTIHNSVDIGKIRTDAFINVRLNDEEDDKLLLVGLDAADHLYNMTLNNDKLYLYYPCDANTINKFVQRGPCNCDTCLRERLGST